MNLRSNFIKMLLFSLILFVSLNIVSAQDNITQTVSDELITSDIQDEITAIDIEAEEISQKTDTKIIVENTNYFYNEKNNLVSYLKDYNGTPIKNKKLKVFLNGKQYDKTTDKSGKITLSFNLKPNNYKLAVEFYGDENFTASTAKSIVKIKKAPLIIKMNSYKTYEDSDSFFKVNVINKITKTPAADIKVLFKLYSLKTKKSVNYYAKTNKKGVAKLNKNLKAGTYKVSTQIKDSKNKKFISFKKSNKKVTLVVKQSPMDEDCCSFYLQVSNTESVGGFRRDGKRTITLNIEPVKWQGKDAIKHYKTTKSYFVHMVVTSDGWMMGNGGYDKPATVHTIEDLVGDMMKSNKIKKSSLKKIQGFKQDVGFGHFSIKAPDGRYAVVWQDMIIIDKLKPGEFSCSPNNPYYYRHDTYFKYGSNPEKAAIKVGATDGYGQRRRNIVVFHWKATTSKDYKTTSQVKVRAANEVGKYNGRSDAKYTDSILFKGLFIMSCDLYKAPDSVPLGVHKFGNIDKYIKTPTIVKAPNVSNNVNQTKYFKVAVKDKKTNKKAGNIKIQLIISNATMSMAYVIKTDANGVAKFNTNKLPVGNYNVAVSQANNKYLISAKSKISIVP